MTRHVGQPRTQLATAASIGSVSRKQNPYRPIRFSISDADDEAPRATKQTEVASQQPDRTVLERQRNPLRVVIVEDEAIISMELELLLEELDAEVVGVAMSAAEAEALVDAQRPDCVTMDVSIKGDRDGVSAARAIFEKYGIRSIFISAYGDAAVKARAEPADPVGWVRKPIEKEDLEEMLNRVKRPD